MKRSLLFSAVLYAASLTSVHAAQPITEPEFASDIVDRYADHIFYGSGATGMALVVIDGNQRVFRSYGETRPGNNVRPQLDSVIRIASLTKLMTSEMLVLNRSLPLILSIVMPIIFFTAAVPRGWRWLLTTVTSASFAVMSKRDLEITFARSWIPSYVLLPSPS